MPTHPYHQATLAALRFAEARNPSNRRFGPDADALWKAFAGDMQTTDRIDLLIRDADAQWPGALGPRTVFHNQGVAEDDPFGPAWQPLDPVDAEKLWREAASVPASVDELLGELAKAWHFDLQAFDLDEIKPTEKLVVAGPSAIAAAIRAFANDKDLDWVEQVVCVASPPAHRHLAAIAGMILNVTKRAEILHASETTGVSRGRRLILSDDADPEDRAVFG